MADYNTPIQQIIAGSGADIRVNENFDAASPSMNYGRRAPGTSGLTWGYYGGRWSGFYIPNGSVSLTASSTNYIVVALVDGTVSVSTANTNWNDTTNYARAYIVVTNGAGATDWDDYRAGKYGTQFASPTQQSPIGRHMVPIVSAAMVPMVNSGCANLTQLSTANGSPDIVTLNFANGVDSYAQFSFSMPKSWNEGVVTAEFVWSQASNAANASVVWALQAVAVRNNVAINTAFGTAQSVTSNGGTLDTFYVSSETANITVGNTPQAEDLVIFRVARKGTSGSDNLTQNARLHSLRLYLTTDAATDA